MTTTPAQILMSIFEGSDLAHGRSEPTDRVSSKGKVEMRSWTEPRPAGLPEWEAHYAGTAGLGIPPIRSDNRVRWGAIDVDIYSGLDLGAFVRDLAKVFPQLLVCRSKSGGPHIFLFLRNWVPALDVVRKLEEVAAFLGFGTSEIFPKQTSISKDGDASDFGNWINMPYFGGTRNLRYCLDPAGEPVLDLSVFQQQVEGCRTELDEIKVEAAVLPERETEPQAQDLPADREMPGLFADGPPCLSRIWATGVSENRNISLANAAVYLKKAFPTNWQPKLDEYNQAMTEPLPSGEVEAIKNSYAKKEYKYQCQKEPLCRYCFARICRERAYGVGGDGLAANNRSLSKFDSDPPVWFLDVDLPDGNVRRISLTTEQLQRFTLFQRRVMETLHQCPGIVKQEFWISVIQSWMKHVSVITVPPDATPKGQFLEHLEDYLSNRPSDENWENILRRQAYKDLTGFFFCWRFFLEYLDQRRFKGLGQGEMVALMKHAVGATPMQKRIGGRNLRLWQVPLEFVKDTEQDLPVPKSTSPF